MRMTDVQARLEVVGCWLSEKVADASAHPFAQIGPVLLCALWFALAWRVDWLTAGLSILAITLTQMVLNRQNRREKDAHRRDVALHASSTSCSSPRAAPATRSPGSRSSRRRRSSGSGKPAELLPSVPLSERRPAEVKGRSHEGRQLKVPRTGLSRCDPTEGGNPGVDPAPSRP